MTIKARFLRITHIFFAILMLIQLLPDKSQKEVCTSSLIVFAIATEAVVIILSFLIKKKESLSLTLDIFGFIYVFMTVWTLATAKFDLLNDLLFPAPGKVIAQFAEDKTVILTNIKSSVGIIIQGFLLAAVAAIPLGLLIGLNARLGNAASYLDKIFQFYSANRIYSIRNCTFTHVPFRFGFCNLSGIVLANICRYNEWCTER